MTALRWMTGFDHVHIQRTGRVDDTCWMHVSAWNVGEPGVAPEYVVMERESGEMRVMRVSPDFPGDAARAARAVRAAALSDLLVCWEGAGVNDVGLLPMSTDHRGGWSLCGDVKTTPSSEPGASVRVESSFNGPRVFTGLRIGPDPRLWEVGPGGLTRVTTTGIWRVDEVTIDGVANDHVVVALEAETLTRTDRSVVVVHGNFGAGSCVSIRATNIGDTASYFYATWELEDVQ